MNKIAKSETYERRIVYFTLLIITLGGHIALIILRAMMGLANGTMYPALSVLLASWVPEKERGKLASFVLGGAQVIFK